MAKAKTLTSRVVRAGKPDVVVLDPPVLLDPDARAIVADVTNKLKLAAAMAAAGVKTAKPSAADKVFQAYFAKRPKALRATIQARAKDLLATGPALRQAQFGRFGASEAKTYQNADHAASTLAPVKFDWKKASAGFAAHGANEAVFTDAGPRDYRANEYTLSVVDTATLQTLGPQDPDAKAGAAYKKLGLFVHKVRCIQESDDWGGDRIALGVVATDPSGQNRAAGPHLIHDDFDDGEQQSYSSGLRLCEWDIVRTSPWPHVYIATIVMAEVDDGGFGVFLTGLRNLMNQEVQAAIAAASGAPLSTTLANLLGPVGTAVNAAVQQMILEIAALMVIMGDDDLIQARSVLLSLAAATKSYYDWTGLNAATPGQWAMDFDGYGGRYRAWFSMKIYA